jgi:hypothetical protein
MSITVTVKDAKIVQEGLALALESTNTAKPGKLVQIEKVFATSMTPAQIKAQVDTEIQLLWLAYSVGSWTI